MIPPSPGAEVNAIRLSLSSVGWYVIWADVKLNTPLFNGFTVTMWVTLLFGGMLFQETDIWPLTVSKSVTGKESSVSITLRAELLPTLYRVYLMVKSLFSTMKLFSTFFEANNFPCGSKSEAKTTTADTMAMNNLMMSV